MKTELIVLTDRSGSMARIRDACISGFHDFIKEQKTVEGECRVTMITFDDTVEVQYQAQPIAGVGDLVLVPRGMTALFDALGLVLTTQNERIAKEKWADLVCVVIVTDGMENASREYKQPQIKEMIVAAEEKGWKFIYLGANQDAMKVAESYGIGTVSGVHGQSFSYDDFGTQMAYACSTETLRQFRTAKPSPTDPTL